MNFVWVHAARPTRASAIRNQGSPSPGQCRHEGGSVHVEPNIQCCDRALRDRHRGALAARECGGGAPESRGEVPDGRYTAASKYAACEQKAFAKYFGGKDFDQKAVSKCRVKYTDVWAKLRAAAQKAPTVETCDADRFVDNGDGTVTDNLTGLQWERKTDDASVHDKDNSYTWTDQGDANSTDADGTAYTGFLAALNGGGCFAGQCDWQLPTQLELQTILSEPFPCTASPCIDEVLFGPTVADAYWSSTTLVTSRDFAWLVLFGTGQGGQVFFNGKFILRPVRAVRGGL